VREYFRHARYLAGRRMETNLYAPKPDGTPAYIRKPAPRDKGDREKKRRNTARLPG
jgi:hypothetical protein